MKKGKESLFINEKGLTLVEVLASIVLLTIILISLLTVFVHSMKATQTSERMIDATYIAQTEMEKIYELSTRVEFDQHSDGMQELEYSGGLEKFEKEIEGKKVKVLLTVESELVKVVIEVFKENKGPSSQVQMENLLEWGLNNE